MDDTDVWISQQRQTNLLTTEWATLLDYGRCFSLTDMRFSEWPCLQASGLKLVWDSSFLPSFFLGRLSSLTRNFYNLCSDCPLWILNNNSMCPDPIYCRVEYDPKGQAGRLLQTPFCMAIFSVMFQTRGGGWESFLRGTGEVEAVWTSLCHRTSFREKVLLSNLCRWCCRLPICVHQMAPSYWSM